MKQNKFLFTVFMAVLFLNFSFAQKVTKENIKVNGECGMCKKKIEKAAKASGATEATWNSETKILSVSYNPASTNNDKIQKAVAAVGYDTEKYKATQEAYNKLDKCCKYEREDASSTGKEEKHSCGDAKCDTEKCGKEKDCCKDKECCKGKDCCSHKDGVAMNEKGKDCSADKADSKSCCAGKKDANCKH